MRPFNLLPIILLFCVCFIINYRYRSKGATQSWITDAVLINKRVNEKHFCVHKKPEVFAVLYIQSKGFGPPQHPDNKYEHIKKKYDLLNKFERDETN